MPVDQSTALVAIVAAGVPSAIVAMLGFFLRTAFADFREGQKETNTSLVQIKDALSEHNTRLAVLEQRFGHLETQRFVHLENEIALWRQKHHDLANTVQALSMRSAVGGQR